MPATTRRAPTSRRRFSAPAIVPLSLRAQLERTAQALPAGRQKTPVGERPDTEILVVGDAPSRIELQHPPQAGRDELRPGVEDHGWQMSVEEVAREEIP